MPESHITLGSPFLTQSTYCLFLPWKCDIQFDRFILVAGAKRRQPGGIPAANKAEKTSSSSELIPTSPTSAFCSVLRELDTLCKRKLKRSNSCIRTTWAGEAPSPISLRIANVSNASG